ncbi:MAG: alpha/beta hydrolase family protein [Deltaproteobacteria bacterium]|nr:alpha/beta hydrolase family protein [Deltaproteobacteria bacterium]MCB9785290.1 alpha/beta hydrolase family protein [Deltaproteobacteria bacterium]
MIRRVALTAAPALDRLFVGGARVAPRRSPRRPGPDPREALAEAAEFYGARGRREQLFAAPPPIAPVERQVRALPGGAVVDLSWPSTYEPVHPAHRRRLLELPDNRTAHARWYRHTRPAPTILWAHGWSLGHPAIEERVFPAGAFYRMGYDVLLPTLPFHSRRRPLRRFRPLWPSMSPILTNEATAQAVHDLRALVALCLARGAPAVGMSGMSLGGYSTAMMVTAEPRLAFAIPFIPFASVAELLWDHAESTPARAAAEARGLTLDHLEDAMAVSSPLRRPPLLPPERILLVAAERDRVTPKRYAEALAAHFGDARLIVFDGGHLLQVGRSEAFRTILRFLRILDLKA